ncbi:MAG: asparagine synthase (glutamine-hydrolyzing) [Rhodospirillaceae bacterium]|nr:asparagine synthase (glutamine-hydrolyzing) [Rhodospirillaceae bacterium]
MCGIGGVWTPSPIISKPKFERCLWDMVATLRHRGPDGEGIWTDGSIGLAHTRLAVLDLSEAGAQPMADWEKINFISYNGEIYNYVSLRNELKNLGFHFRSKTDTEVILAGYQKWGVDILNKLTGMFAIALWDSKNKTLLLARDRFGKKPLYYSWKQNCLYFGSEIKSILAGSRMKPKADINAIDQYLTYQYVPGVKTGFEGISKVRPGCYLVIKPDGLVIEKTYWKPTKPPEIKNRSEKEISEEILLKFDIAVADRMVSDVPIGAFLSGGIDSASIVASMAKNSTQPIKTFTMGFEEPNFDERQLANLVAEKYQTDHYEHVIKPDVINILDKLVWHYGVPFADSSSISSFCVAELARKHVTVALSGDGGDEIFLGYSRYAATKLAGYLDKMPRFILNSLAAFGSCFPFQKIDYKKVRYAERFLSEILNVPYRRYGNWICFFSNQAKSELYTEAFLNHDRDKDFKLIAPYFVTNTDPPEANAAWSDIHNYLPDNLLVKTDIATMAYGLEARSPFLDHHFFDFALSIPSFQKMQGLKMKSLLKRTMIDRLPTNTLKAPKAGFGVPVERWFKKELKNIAYDTLLSKRSLERGLFEKSGIQKLLDDHVLGLSRNQNRLWALLFLELWFRMWIDSPTIPNKPSGQTLKVL